MPTAALDLAKLLFNSVVSTPNAKFCTVDIIIIYLNTPMTCYEYMKIHISLIPPKAIKQYNLNDITDSSGNMHVEIRKGMYGLPQAGRIAHSKLKLHLAQYGYKPVPIMPGLWQHKDRDITFCLVVDDFGIKYTTKNDLEHLITALQEIYRIKIDMTGELLCDITLQWNYDNWTVVCPCLAT
eukprot:13503691-Ditylum_brightwellii.AAC.1